MPQLPNAPRVRFGLFELDLQSGDLRKAGARVRISGQPLAILGRLVSSPGKLVSREELRRELWSEDTFVDFERNLNSAVQRLRAALGDSADAPRFIETIPKRGYRFLAPLHGPSGPAAVPAKVEQPAPSGGNTAAPKPSAPQRWRRRVPGWILVGGAALIPLVAAGGVAYRGSRTATTPVRALVVLPFGATAADGRNDDYLSFGMTDAITTEVSRLNGLAVISQTTAMQYAEAGKSLPQIARELGVDAVVEGSVMRNGNRVRVTAQLIDARSDGHLWTGTYEREIEVGFPIFRDVAGAIAREIHRTIGLPTPVRASDSASLDQRVHESYLRGRYHLAKGTEAELSKARQYFEEAVAADPAYAPAHSGLADYYVLTEALPPQVAFPKARIHAGHALALDQTLADAYISLAFVHYYGDWAWDAAEREFTRALELDPNHARGLRRFGLLLAALGRHQEAKVHLDRALAVGPMQAVSHDAAAQAMFNARAYDDVLVHAQALQKLDPEDPRGYEHQGLGLIQKGQYVGALAAVDRGLAFDGNNSALRSVRAISLARLGRVADATEILNGLDEPRARDYVPPILIAAVATALGQNERALDRLERGYAMRDPYMVLLKESPLFDALRPSPRFQSIANRMKFPQ